MLPPEVLLAALLPLGLDPRREPGRIAALTLAGIGIAEEVILNPQADEWMYFLIEFKKLIPGLTILTHYSHDTQNDPLPINIETTCTSCFSLYSPLESPSVSHCLAPYTVQYTSLSVSTVSLVPRVSLSSLPQSLCGPAYVQSL